MRIDPAVVMRNWEKRNIAGLCCGNIDEACGKILEMIPLSASVGFSGSLTLDQLGIVSMLESRGNKVFNQYQPDISREAGLEIRRQGANADYFLTSANAIAQTGELIFLSAYGHRISGIANSKNVLVVCGENKIVPSLQLAVTRAREYVTPWNCKRLNYNSACFKDGACHNDDCFSPEYKRMCCQLLIIEAEITPGRLKVILVKQELGF